MPSSYSNRLGTAPEEAVKAPCVVAAVTNITLSGEQTIGVTAVVAGDRVLVAGQTDPTENGIYDAAAGAWSRATDWNAPEDVISGQLVAVPLKLYQASFTGAYNPNITEVSFSELGISTGYTQQSFTATDGQTLFTLSNTYTRGIGALAVYINGVFQDPSAFTETSTTSFTLSEGVDAGDLVTTVISSFTTLADSISSSLVTYSPVGTGAVATNVQTKLRQNVSVQDFGAIGNGVADDAGAFQAAIDFIESRGNQGVLYIPNTGSDYIIGSTLTLSKSIELVGEKSRLSFTNASGAAIRFKSNNSGLRSLTIFASGARASASFAVANPGVWIASDDDVSDASVSNFSMYDTQISGHPGDGLLGESNLIGFVAIDCSVVSNKGHNFCFDRGERTGRVNKSTPGIIKLDTIKATGAGGHAVAVGHPDDAASILYRFTANNVDSGNTDSSTTGIRYVASNWYVKGENHMIENCGLGGQNTVQGDAANLYSIHVIGRGIHLNNNRYINCSPNAITIGYDSGSISTSDIWVNSMRVITDAPDLDPAIVVEAGVDGGIFARVPYLANITSVISESGTQIEYSTLTQKVLHRQTLDAPALFSEQAITINDDSVATLSFSGTAPRGTLVLSGSVSGAGHAVVAFRTTNSVFTRSLGASSEVALTTGALTGTTGTDTELTISAHTDGNLYIENRTGATRSYSITFLSMGNGLYTTVSDDS